MRNLNINIVIFMILLAYGFGYSQSSNSYKVIVNKTNSIEEIDQSDLSDMFLKNLTKWPDKKKITPVDLNSESKTRASFSKSVHNKSFNAIKAYWQKKIFTGKGVPPVEKNSDAEVIAFVKENEGAIGYISSDASSSGVKVIKVKE